MNAARAHHLRHEGARSQIHYTAERCPPGYGVVVALPAWPCGDAFPWLVPPEDDEAGAVAVPCPFAFGLPLGTGVVFVVAPWPFAAPFGVFEVLGAWLLFDGVCALEPAGAAVWVLLAVLAFTGLAWTGAVWPWLRVPVGWPRATPCPGPCARVRRATP
jgi:hypothetical protein